MVFIKTFWTRFDTSNYELNTVLPKGKNKKIIGVMKDELGRKNYERMCRLRAKTYSHLTDDGVKIEKQTTQKRVIKRKLKCDGYKNCLEGAQLEKASRKIKIDVNIPKENHKELIKNNKLILKTQHDLEVKSIMLFLNKLTRLL